MRSEDRLQTLLNQAHIDSSKTTDRRILAEAANAIVSLKRRQTPQRVIAAIVLITMGLAFWTHNPPAPVMEHQEQAIQPEQILTMASLKQSYYQGGMEALEKQLNRGLTLFGPASPTAIKASSEPL
jgi:hypothetical protein